MKTFVRKITELSHLDKTLPFLQVLKIALGYFGSIAASCDSVALIINVALGVVMINKSMKVFISLFVAYLHIL